jgi:carbonic anhydrase
VSNQRSSASWHVDYPAQTAAAKLELTFADGARGDYSPLQFHFHAPSEHTVDQKYFDAEMHFVHQSAAGEFAVFGIFFDKVVGGAEDNPFLTTLFDSMSTAGENVAIKNLLANIKSNEFYSYDGSFTTPPCTEGVKWSVLKKVQPISQTQFTKFTQRLAGNAAFASGNGNNRVIMPIEDRTIYMTKDGGAAAGLTFAALAALTALAF